MKSDSEKLNDLFNLIKTTRSDLKAKTLMDISNLDALEDDIEFGQKELMEKMYIKALEIISS